MKKIYSFLFLMFVLLFCGNLYIAQSQTFAPLPFVENFDNIWVDIGSTHDVPSLSWSNSPLSGNASWRRDDEGVSQGVWDDSFGEYSPSGAKATSHSARFHSYDSDQHGVLNAFIDFSTIAGNKLMSFDYININGSDSLEIYLSINGGKYFSKIKGLKIQTAWNKFTINLGVVTTTKGIIQFKASGDAGFSDIGIDELSITGASTLVANFSADAKTVFASNGIVNFKDISTGNPTSWKWDFNNDGIIDATIQNPSYNFVHPGVYSVKLIVGNQSTTDTLILDKLISVSSKLTVPCVEHFDNAWTNLNDVRDIPSYGWVNTPATGSNSWSRDDDGSNRGAWGGESGVYSPSGANSTLHSARFHSYFSQDPGILDLNVDFSKSSGSKTLTYYYVNTDGNDSLEVFISGGLGSPFVKIDGQKISSDWKLITINLDNISYPNGILRFKANGDFGASDIGIDEVSISGVGVSTDVKADFSANVLSGDAPLVVRYMDLSENNPTSWNWDFNNDGAFDATTQNPTFSYSTPGIYNVKLSVNNATSNDAIVKNANILVTGYSKLPFVENFDHTWISLNDTIDVPSLYCQSLPATGVNSWSRDDEGISRKAWHTDNGAYSPSGANGTAHSASFNSYESSVGQQGVIDMKINFSSAPKNDTLYYSFINKDGTDSLEVFLSTDKGLSFIKIGSNKTVDAWAKCKIALGNVNASQGVIRFVATSDFLESNIGIDEVSVTGLVDYFVKSFTLPSQTGLSVFDSVNHTISINMPYTPSVSSLVASFTLSSGASAKVGVTDQESGTTLNNFSNHVVYSVTDKDGVASQDWEVIVTVAKNNETDILSYTVPNQSEATVIDHVNHTVSAKISASDNLIAIISTFVLSGGASSKVGNVPQVSQTTQNDFSSPVSYIVLAEDGTTSQTWVVTISKPNGISQKTDEIGAIVFPNPSSGIFKIQLTSAAQGKIVIDIYDLKGVKILSKDAVIDNAEEIIPFDLSAFPAGLYNLIIRKADSTIQIKLNKI